MKRNQRILGCVVAVILMSMFGGIAQGAMLVQYSYDEGSGNALNGGTATDADGIFHNDATRSTDTPGSYSSYSLDVTNATCDYTATAGDVSELDNLSQFTVSFWIKLPSDPTAMDRAISFEQGSGGDPGLDVLFETGCTASAFKLRLRVGENLSSQALISTATYDASNKWTFVAFTVDLSGTDTAVFYTGDETAAVAQLGDAVTRTLDLTDYGDINNGPVTVGNICVTPDTWDKTAPSLMDDVRIYDTVLSSSELDAVRQEILVPEPATLCVLLAGGFLGSIRRRR